MNHLLLTITMMAGEVVEHTSYIEGIVNDIVPEIIGLIELIGIFVITVGSLRAFVLYVRALLYKNHFPVKLALGNSLALGLEFKMGAEILKTVIIRSKDEIYMLGCIIVLRALLSVLIHFEVKSEKEHGGSEEVTASDY
ncbi:DUF1622 domain-containing protein [Dielma fastidiosa]|uniref:DUF1622 domain-containing protein n=1 Tax=Dielma fastidiosa TaxID=1034346 RepID=A0AB35UNS6_9FIRM|nr:DUF1622 domain-containing protein [Dielma fastidiosa]MDY5169073.1 DUF1622 domain-containing protein [Dielma fastidiosa]